MKHWLFVKTDKVHKSRVQFISEGLEFLELFVPVCEAVCVLADLNTETALAGGPAGLSAEASDTKKIENALDLKTKTHEVD